VRWCGPRKPRQQLIEGDREVTHAHARCVKDRIGDCSAGSADAQLADSFDPKFVGVAVEVIEDDGVDGGNIRGGNCS
jgi:hypothetical protein